MSFSLLNSYCSNKLLTSIYDLLFFLPVDVVNIIRMYHMEHLHICSTSNVFIINTPTHSYIWGRINNSVIRNPIITEIVTNCIGDYVMTDIHNSTTSSIPDIKDSNDIKSIHANDTSIVIMNHHSNDIIYEYVINGQYKKYSVCDSKDVYFTKSSLAISANDGVITNIYNNIGLKNVRNVCTTSDAFAIRTHNNIIIWDESRDRKYRNSRIQNMLDNVINIYDGYNSFVASTKDNKILCWGDYGDIVLEETGNIIMVAGCCNILCIITDTKTFLIEKKNRFVSFHTINERNIKTLISNEFYIIGIRNDDTLFCYGNKKYDNICINDDIKIKHVCLNLSAVAVVLYDGSVLTFGDPKYGGDSSSVQPQLNNIVDIVATNYAFMAKTADDHIVLWGSEKWGGNIIDINEIINQ